VTPSRLAFIEDQLESWKDQVTVVMWQGEQPKCLQNASVIVLA
jgi:hypothetical protein